MILGDINFTSWNSLKKYIVNNRIKAIGVDLRGTLIEPARSGLISELSQKYGISNLSADKLEYEMRWSRIVGQSGSAVKVYSCC